MLRNYLFIFGYGISYHFAGSEGVFYAREPYLNTGVTHTTRFIGLAAVGNDKKQVCSLLFLVILLLLGYVYIYILSMNSTELEMLDSHT